MRDRFIKLVRDRVGDDRDQVIYKQVQFTDSDFHWALRRKLVEEAIEYMESGDWEELIDVFEVVWALCDVHGRGFGHLKIDADRKRVERGSFRSRVALWIRRSNG